MVNRMEWVSDAASLPTTALITMSVYNQEFPVGSGRRKACLLSIHTQFLNYIV